MAEWNSIWKRLPRNGQRIEVKIGNTIKRIIYTAGMKGDDLRFCYWRDAGYDDWYKPTKNYLNYGERQ